MKKYYIEVNMDGNDLFADEKEELPEEWHETFDTLVAQGKSPTGVIATIEYVTTPKTQQEVSLEYDISTVTIRSLQAAVVALGPIDPKEGGLAGDRRTSRLDFCEPIAEELGWEEGVEYSLTRVDSQKTAQPRLLKQGWRALYQTIVDGDDEDRANEGKEGQA